MVTPMWRSASILYPSKKTLHVGKWVASEEGTSGIHFLTFGTKNWSHIFVVTVYLSALSVEITQSSVDMILLASNFPQIYSAKLSYTLKSDWLTELYQLSLPNFMKMMEEISN